MFEGKFSLRTHPDSRYVPAYATHRICRLFFAFAFLVSTICFAELRQGTVAEIKKDAELLREPREAAGSYGLLPLGTLLKITGEPDGNFLPVEVELERGTLEGWIRSDLLGLEEQDREKEARAAEKQKKAISEKAPLEEVPTTTAKKGRRRRIPQDESLLFRRTPSFFYGVEAGPTFSIINAIGNSFSGIGVVAGADAGFYLGDDLPLRIEILYNLLSGVDGSGNQVSFGFLDIGASLAYHLNSFEFYGRLSYGLGISVSNLPGSLGSSFTSVTDLSSVWAGAGVGYRFTVSAMTKITARLNYSLSFLQSPFSFQTIGLIFLFDLQG